MIALELKRLTDLYRRISAETEMLFLAIKSVSLLSHTKSRQILHPLRYPVTATVLRSEIKDTLSMGGQIVKQTLPYTYTEREKMPEIV
jgi:hypothetical protein